MEKEKRKSTPSSKQIRAFAKDLYEYIWTKHTFCSSYLEEKFAEQLSLKLQAEKTEVTHFNEDIGKAVLCSQYLLRGLCSDYFKRMEKYMAMSKSSFIYCVYLTQFMCRDFRNDIFLTLIDACAIIAEAFLFSDSKGGSGRELFEAEELLITLFELQITKTFFQKGGWLQLQKQALEQFSPVYLFLTPYMKAFGNSYESLPHDCEITKFFRESPVVYPVHISKLCGGCISQTDELTCFSFCINYPVEEFLKEYSLEIQSSEKEEYKTILAKKENFSECKPSLTNSTSYIFLGSNKENIAFIANNMEKTLKKRKRKLTQLERIKLENI